MKKIFNILLLLLILLSLTACLSERPDDDNKPPIVNTSEVKLQFLAVNDTHGYIEDTTTASISKTAAFIKDQKVKESTETIVLAVGDMFQGTAISNLTEGKTVVDCMNEIGFDSMSIGNHEFDWGIDKIARFNDGILENGEAEFPFLAANIVYKDTDTLMEFTKPYEIVERAGVRVGIIGVIGESLTNSISARMVSDYEFLNVVDVTKKYAKELRVEQDCDIVVLSYHYGSSGNTLLTDLTGDYKLDAIFNAHTHIAETKNTPIPQIQSKSNGEYVGELSIIYDKDENKVIETDVTLHQVSRMSKKDTVVAKIVSDTNEIIAPLINEKLGTMTTRFNKTQLAIYGCQVMKTAFNVDFAMVNAGGYRTNFTDYQVITFGDMVKMVPFDNEIKLVTLTGAQVISIYNNSGDIVEYPVDYGDIDPTKEYRVAAIDYIFDKTNYVFLSGKDIVITGLKFRDILVEDLKLAGDNFNIYGDCFIGQVEW